MKPTQTELEYKIGTLPNMSMIFYYRITLVKYVPLLYLHQKHNEHILPLLSENKSFACYICWCKF